MKAIVAVVVMVEPEVEAARGGDYAWKRYVDDGEGRHGGGVDGKWEGMGRERWRGC